MSIFEKILEVVGAFERNNKKCNFWRKKYHRLFNQFFFHDVVNVIQNSIGLPCQSLHQCFSNPPMHCSLSLHLPILHVQSNNPSEWLSISVCLSWLCISNVVLCGCLKCAELYVDGLRNCILDPKLHFTHLPQFNQQPHNMPRQQDPAVQIRKKTMQNRLVPGIPVCKKERLFFPTVEHTRPNYGSR